MVVEPKNLPKPPAPAGAFREITELDVLERISDAIVAVHDEAVRIESCLQKMRILLIVIATPTIIAAFAIAVWLVSR